MSRDKKRQDANEEAENRWMRRQWGDSTEINGDGEDDMGTQILGDVNHPAPVIMQQPTNNTIPAALLALGLAAGGYFLGTPQEEPSVVPPPQKVETDETISFGLGKIEDYIQKRDVE